MENEEYQIIRYRPEYKDQIIQLQTYLWGADIAQNRAYFDWKYECSPYHSAPLFYMAVRDGQVAAIRGFIGSRWQAGTPAQTVECLLIGDSVTHPDHRRKGLFSTITNKAEEDLASSPYAFILNLGSGPLSTSANLKLGWANLAPNLIGTCFPKAIRKEPQGIRKLIRQIPILYPLYRAMRGKAGSYLKSKSTPPAPVPEPSTQFHLLDAYFAGRESRSGQGSNPPTAPAEKNIWMSKTPQPDRMADFIARSAPNGKMRQVRDQTFYGWRYGNPRADYRFLFSGREQIDGFMVLRESKYPKSAEVKIVDWEVSNLTVLGDLLRTAVNAGKFNALTVWATTLSAAEKQVFQEAHFSFDFEKGGDGDSARPSVLIKQIAPTTPENWAFTSQKILDVNLWDIRSIYSDGF